MSTPTDGRGTTRFNGFHSKWATSVESDFDDRSRLMYHMIHAEFIKAYSADSPFNAISNGISLWVIAAVHRALIALPVLCLTLKTFRFAFNPIDPIEIPSLVDQLRKKSKLHASITNKDPKLDDHSTFNPIDSIDSIAHRPITEEIEAQCEYSE